MKPPFDIAGDLDTPVSAFAKLAAFRPRFLLESVEGGERLGRYSFIGFGDGLHVRLDAGGLHVGDAVASGAGRCGEPCSRACAQALARAPRPQPRDRPASRCPAVSSATPPTTPCAISSACRGRGAAARMRRDAALCRAALAARLRSPDARHRAAARRQRGRTRRAAPRGRPRRCAVPLPATLGRPGRYSLPTAALSREQYMAGVRRTQEYIAAGDVYQLVLVVALRGPPRARPVRGLPCAAAASIPPRTCSSASSGTSPSSAPRPRRS